MNTYIYTLHQHDVARDGSYNEIQGSTIALEDVAKVDPVFSEPDEKPIIYKIRIFMKSMPKPIIIGFGDKGSALTEYARLIAAWEKALL